MKISFRWQVILLTLALLCFCSSIHAQNPVIHSFSPSHASVKEEITISGSDFGNKNDLKIFFGAVAVDYTSINESNSSAIKVMVPPGATFGPITVLNMASNKSAISPSPFTPSFGGGGFSLDKLSSPLNFIASSFLYDLQLADLDGDNYSEILLSFTGASNLSIYKNNSSNDNISFTKIDIPSGGTSHSIAYGDLNGNGKIDIILSGYSPSNFLYFLENSSTPGNISFNSPISFPLSTTGAEQVSLYDFDNDGKPDIVLTNKANNQIYIYKNESVAAGNINFSATPVSFSLPAEANSKGLAIADLDNDQMPEIIVTNETGNIHIFPNKSSNSNISFGTPVTILSPSGGINLMAGDFDADGKNDLAITNQLYNQVNVWLNNSTTTGEFKFGGIKSIQTDSRPSGLQLSDINGDGKTDIVVGHVTFTSVAVLINESTPGNAQFTKHSVTGIEKNRQVRAGDLNGDGKPEIVYTSLETNKVSILKNNICIYPKIFPQGDQVVCNGSDGNFALHTYQGQGLSYVWKLNGVAINGAASYKLDNITESGNYTVEITESNNTSCPASTSPPVKVTIGAGSAVPTPEFYETLPICEGQQINLRAKELSGATYIWSGPNNFSKTTSTPTVTIENATVQMKGLYSLVIESGSCRSEAVSRTVDVRAVSKPVISYNNSNATVCGGSSVTLTATAGYSSYKWLREGEYITGATLATYQATRGGNYTVLVSNGICSSESIAVSISGGNTPEANFLAPDVTCVSQAINFTNKTTATINEPLVYSWNFGDGNTSTLESPSHTYTGTNSSSEYTVTLSVRYQTSNCTDSFSKTIRVNQSTDIINLEAPAGTEFCPGETIPLQITGDAVDASWSNGATGLKIEVSEAGTYTANVQTLSGCTISHEISVSHFAPPVVEVVADKNLIKKGEVAYLQATGGAYYEWSPAEGLDNPSAPNPVASPMATTTYTVTAFSEDGCSSQAEITIELDNKVYVDASTIFLPFEESYWKVNQIENYPELTLYILNRFGKTLYKAQPYQNQWDGRMEGKVLEEGVYYYVFKDPSGKPVKSGSISIIH